MKAIFLAVAVSLCWANLAQAQAPYYWYDPLYPVPRGKQVITEVPDFPAPKTILAKGQPQPQAGKPIEGKVDFTPSATAGVIKIRNWSSGKGFVDDQGRRWRMVRGACMERFPPELTGWRLITVEGEECFFTITGRLFTSQ